VILSLALISVLQTSADPWFGADKVKHFLVSAFLQSISYSVLRTANTHHRTALAGASGVTTVFGVGKEIRDLRARGEFSARDLVWDAAGAGAASLLLDRTRRWCPGARAAGARLYSAFIPGRIFERRGRIAVALQLGAMMSEEQKRKESARDSGGTESADDRRHNAGLRALIDEMLQQVRDLNRNSATWDPDERVRAEQQLEFIMARVRERASPHGQGK
jgi:uncharacterized protein YfiM (DUF2279 family)